MYDVYLTISQAAVYSEFPIPKWFQWLRRGWIQAFPELDWTRQTRKDEQHLATVIRVHVSAMPIP